LRPLDDIDAALAAHGSDLFPPRAGVSGESADHRQTFFGLDAPHGMVALFNYGPG
jgi:hypothetical protein